MYEIQTVECGGIPCTEYRYEPEIPDDPEPEFALTCGQCDYYIANKADLTMGCCALTGKTRRSTSLACPKIYVTSPF
jgi:hypothetical protein